MIALCALCVLYVNALVLAFGLARAAAIPTPTPLALHEDDSK